MICSFDNVESKSLLAAASKAELEEDLEREASSPLPSLGLRASYQNVTNITNIDDVDEESGIQYSSDDSIGSWTEVNRKSNRLLKQQFSSDVATKSNFVP